MKKVTALTFALVMAISLAACSTKQVPSSSKSDFPASQKPEISSTADMPDSSSLSLAEQSSDSKGVSADIFEELQAVDSPESVPENFTIGTLDDQYFLVASDDYMWMWVFNDNSTDSYVEAMRVSCDVTTLRSFDTAGNVIYMVTRMIFNTEADAEKYVEIINEVGDHANLLEIDGTTVYRDFSKMENKIAKSELIYRFTENTESQYYGASFWCSKP